MLLLWLIAGGAIPDAAAIHAARKKREAAREKGGKEDFIPIKNVEKKSSKGPRLLREEDEDDEEERICFTVKEKAKEDEYHKKVGKGREAQDDSDSDPEWEKMQISKAINNQQVCFDPLTVCEYLFGKWVLVLRVPDQCSFSSATNWIMANSVRDWLRS